MCNHHSDGILVARSFPLLWLCREEGEKRGVREVRGKKGCPETERSKRGERKREGGIGRGREREGGGTRQVGE